MAELPIIVALHDSLQKQTSESNLTKVTQQAEEWWETIMLARKGRTYFSPGLNHLRQSWEWAQGVRCYEVKKLLEEDKLSTFREQPMQTPRDRKL